MRLLALLSSLSLLLGGFAIRLCPAQRQTTIPNGSSPANTSDGAVVKAAMKNVDFHLTDRITVHIATLDGKLIPNHSGVPVFDDKESFYIDVDSATITVSTTALSNDLNDYVFAKPDAPLKKLTVTVQDNELIVKGLLASKGGIPFETDGTATATPDGLIRVHTTKVKALHLQVKGLMDMLGLDTANILSTNKVKGVTLDKDDLILDPQQILPPPQIRGHLTSIQIANGALRLVFQTPGREEQHAAISSSCGGRNFQAFKGGSFRFGKLTMNDGDLELIDSDPGDPFDFSIDHYKDQLVAGYSKITRQGGLCVHMPDFAKLRQDTHSNQ